MTYHRILVLKFKKKMLDRLRLSGPNGLFFTSGKNEAKRVTDC